MTQSNISNEADCTTAEYHVQFTASEAAIDAALYRIEAFLDKYIITPLLGKGEAID